MIYSFIHLKVIVLKISENKEEINIFKNFITKKGM